MTILFDSREPDPHPWARHLPADWRIERGTLETGDIALARLPEGVVIERKTPSDLAGCIGASRQRFERELRRERYVGRFLMVVEGNLSDVQRACPWHPSELHQRNARLMGREVLPDHLCGVDCGSGGLRFSRPSLTGSRHPAGRAEHHARNNQQPTNNEKYKHDRERNK